MDCLLEDLNEEQRRAVCQVDGPMLVMAGAGSGKTRVITRKIAWLMSGGVRDHEILGLTFTNKAANEMSQRVEQLMPGNWVRLSTFHSACARFLRQCCDKIGYERDFTIVDVEDRNNLVKRIMTEQHLPKKEYRPALLGSQISTLKGMGIAPEDQRVEGRPGMPDFFGRVFQAYQTELEAMNKMDFDDLLLNFFKVLDEHEDERKYFQNRIRYILVDEFQDTNEIQYRILKLLSAKHKNICVVGDPDQSIYSFRGAEIGNILNFPNDFENCQVFKLETNYRSTKTILDFAQKVIENNSFRHDKVLLPIKDEGEGVCYLVCDSAQAEAREVAVQARSLLDQGVDPSEIAVFYRARFLSRSLEEAMRRLNLPFKVVGDLGFFERKEIKDLLAFLQVVVNPRDHISLSRFLNVPPRGIGRVSEEKLFAAAQQSGLAIGEYLRRGLKVSTVRGKAAKGLAEIGALLEEAWTPSLTSVEQTLRLFLDRSDYLDYVCEEAAFADIAREENVKELLLHTKLFDREFSAGAIEGVHEMGAVVAYLCQVTLATELSRRETGSDGPEPARIQLMTVHSSKGLEFDNVFIIGLEEGIFPHSQSMESARDVEEERRLFYVAVTRARERVFCLRAQLRERYDAGMRYQDASRFLREAGLEESQAANAGQAGASDVRSDFDAQLRDPPLELDESPEQPGFDGLDEGVCVQHERFGTGTILRRFGAGRNSKVEVLFESGVRMLLLEYARLERVEEM